MALDLEMYDLDKTNHEGNKEGFMKLFAGVEYFSTCQKWHLKTVELVKILKGEIELISGKCEVYKRVVLPEKE